MCSPRAGKSLIIILYSRFLQDITPVILIEIMTFYRNGLMRLWIVEDRVLLSLPCFYKATVLQISDGFLQRIHLITSDGYIIHKITQFVNMFAQKYT